MTTPIIELQHIQKIYKLYSRPSYRLLETLWPFGPPRHEKFFALRDINFSLLPGQSLGIVGRNGSGKSTLLKIIAQVLTPTSGTATVNGSLGCLLELGGGFNPELTGRENAELQMLLSGQNDKDEKLIADIIDFTEIGVFIEQPVKTYSSGMFMRLAFACATVMAPKILIVDEALAVGDTYFVKKSMNRMRQLMEGGTTLLFVSHDLESVRRMCGLTLLLDQGQQLAFGPTNEVAEQYVAFLRMGDQAERASIPDGPPLSSNIIREALHSIPGQINLAEQRLFLSGIWTWQTDPESGLAARCTEVHDAKAAFTFFGNRLELTFIRGGGFVLPQVHIDGHVWDLSTENDLPFLDPSLAPPQVRSFTLSLPEGDHVAVISASATPIAWLGGASGIEKPTLVFQESKNWEESLSSRTVIYGDRQAIVTQVELLDIKGEPATTVLCGQMLRFRIHVKRLGTVKNISIGFKIHNRLSVGIFGTTTREEHHALNDHAPMWVVEFMFTVPLKAGEYTISAAASSVEHDSQFMHHYIDLAAAFTVLTHPQRTVWGEIHNAVQITIAEGCCR